MRHRVYIKTFNSRGIYNSEFTEITKYVQSIGNIAIDTDSSEYQIGVFKNSNVAITLNNREGLFSEVGQPKSMFPYRRGNSIVRITYDIANYEFICGFGICGEDFLSNEVTIFEGLLNDDAALEEAKTEDLKFVLLGYESIFENETVPFSTFVAGDDQDELIFKLLNQASILKYLTVDALNINCGLPQDTDNVDGFENQTVKEALDRLLYSANSVFEIRDATVYVKPRTPTVAIQKSFYGQSSNLGVENISDIKNISNGISRTFNFWTWREASIAFAVNTSIKKNGKIKRELDFDFFTDTIKRRNILEAMATEFGNKKQELDLITPLDYETLALNLLDRINIDYPTVTVPWEDFPLPICGQAVCGVGVLPRGLWSLTIAPEKNYKIIKKTVSTKAQTVTLKIREI